MNRIVGILPVPLQKSWRVLVQYQDAISASTDAINNVLQSTNKLVQYPDGLIACINAISSLRSSEYYKISAINAIINVKFTAKCNKCQCLFLQGRLNS